MHILFDIGGTKTRIASSDGEKINEISVISSPSNLDDALDTLLETSENLARDSKIDSFAGGITAVLDGSRGKKTRTILEQKSGGSAFVGNDSEIVGLGEAVYGAGKEYSIVQYITVSTGVGGSKISNGKINPLSGGFEPGHQIIDFKNSIALEDLVSGKALEKKYGTKPKEIKDENLWPDLGKILAVGIYNSAIHWMPEVIVLGGSMITGDPAIPMESIIEELKKINNILPKIPPVKKAELQDHGGLYGALAFLRQQK